jgi:1,4-alpha-glucan branching enzyme
VFRVWAPEAQHAELVLIGPNSPADDTVLAMRRDGGNFAARAPGVRAVSPNSLDIAVIEDFLCQHVL